jgi:hypothetical protein
MLNYDVNFLNGEANIPSVEEIFSLTDIAETVAV